MRVNAVKCWSVALELGLAINSNAAPLTFNKRRDARQFLRDLRKHGLKGKVVRLCITFDT